MKILITGASGLLGSRLTKYFKNKKYDVYPIGFTNNQIRKCNLTKLKEFDILYNKIKPNIIINLACLSDVDTCEYNLEKAINLNSLVLKNINKIIKDDNVKIVHISTDHLYNSSGKNKEDNIIITNNYSLSKYIGEKYILNKKFIILRTNFFGKSISSKQSFSDWILSNYKNNNINLFEDVYFNPISISTLCQIISKVMKSNKYGIYNVGSSKVISKYQFGKLLIKLKGTKSKIKKTSIYRSNLVAKRPQFMGMNVNLFNKTFNFKEIDIKNEILKEI